MTVAAYIISGIGLGRVGVHPANRSIEVTGDRDVVLTLRGRIVIAQVVHPGRDAISIDVGMTGFTLDRTMRSVSVERSSLGIAGGVNGRGHWIETVNRLVTALAADILVATSVAHQAGLGGVVERREGREVAALLDVRRRMAVRTVGFAG